MDTVFFFALGYLIGRIIDIAQRRHGRLRRKSLLKPARHHGLIDR